MNSAYYKNITIYEVNLRQYTCKGDIQSFITHLYRLKEMGIEVIWLMPIHPIGIINRKGSLGSPYTCSDFYKINPDFGTAEDFKFLVETVHNLGMRIIIDWVANHTSWDHVWTESNPEYYIKDESGNFISPYDWTDVIQLNHHHESMHNAMIDAMKYWISEYDIDGFRADIAHLSPLDFWKRCRNEIEIIKPDLIWLGETEDSNYYQAFDLIYAWDWMHQTKNFIDKNISKNDFDIFLQSMQSSPRLYFTSNHDENSWNGTEFEKYGIYAKALSVFTFIFPNSVPLIYSGQEIPNLNRLSFFDKDEIDWKRDVQLYSFYKTLIEERKQILNELQIEYIPSNKKMIAFRLNNDEEMFFIFLSFEEESLSFEYNLSNKEYGFYKNIFSSKIERYDSNINLELSPGEYIVLRQIK